MQIVNTIRLIHETILDSFVFVQFKMSPSLTRLQIEPSLLMPAATVGQAKLHFQVITKQRQHRLHFFFIAHTSSIEPPWKMWTLNLLDSLGNKTNWASPQRAGQYTPGAHCRARKRGIDELVNTDHLQSTRLLTGNY